MPIGTELNVTPKKVVCPRIEVKERGKLILTRKLQAQIAYSHKQVGNIEWIGILMYKKLEGDIDAPKSLVLQADKFFLMDIGTSGHTDAIVDAEELCNLHDANPDIIDEGLCQGLIHTHHSMTTFFSGEDWSELNDNTESHNYYLSLIVNNAGPYAAKVAYMADVANEWNYKNANDVPVVSKTITRYMVTMDLDIFFEDAQVEQPFMDRHTYIKDKLAAAKASKFVTNSSWAGHVWKGGAWIPDVGFAANRWANVPNQGEMDLPEVDSLTEVFRDSSSEFAREANRRGKKGNKGGNRHNTGAHYGHSSDTLTDRQARDIALRWLNSGLEVEPYQKDVTCFQTITEGLGYFEEKYRKSLSANFPHSEENFRYFQDCMQKALVDDSADYKPSVTAKRVGAIFQDYATNPAFGGKIAKILANIAEAHPIYLQILRQNEKEFNNSNKLEKWK